MTSAARLHPGWWWALRSAVASAKPPTYIYIYLPTVSAASEREVEERVVVVVVVAGALARNRRIVYLYLSLPRWNGGRMPLSFSEEDSPSSGRLLLSFRVFLRVSHRSLQPPVLLYRRRRHGIAENSRVPIDIRYQSYRTPTNSILPQLSFFLSVVELQEPSRRFAVITLRRNK